MAMLTTAEVAERLGITPVGVRRMIQESRLRATKFGRDWLVVEADLEGVTPSKAGYPKGKPRK